MDLIFIAHLLNGLLMVGMPIGLAFYLTWKFHAYWRLWWIGAGTFILSQVVHIPFNGLVGNLLGGTSMILWSPSALLLFNAVFGGLSAGLFEELFRYGMYRWWAKEARSWRTAVLAGAGHGGAEAIIIGIVALFYFINSAVLRNADPAVYGISADQIPVMQQALQTYWTVPWYGALLGALERFFTMIVQISFSVSVIQAFIRRQGFWVVLAILFHALVDAVAVYASGSIGVYWTEAIIGGFAVIALFIIMRLYAPEPEPVGKSTRPPLPPDYKMKPLDETPENLDKTKYR